jgi:hypothetical protein
MARETFHLELPRDLSDDERRIFELALKAAWEVVQTRADRLAALHPHARPLERFVPNLQDVHGYDDEHRHIAVLRDHAPDVDEVVEDPEVGTRVFTDDDPLTVAQLHCADCGRELCADDPGEFLVCPQVADHPDRATAAAAGVAPFAVDCGQLNDGIERPYGG